MTESKAKSKGTSRTGKPRKSATRSKARPKAGAKGKPIKVREGQPASRPSGHLNRDGGDWREETLTRMRALILEADHEMIEERKWRKPSNAMAGVPVWSHHGIVCTGETYTNVVKLTFAGGPASRIHRTSSIPAWKATPEGRSTSTKGSRSTRAPFRLS
jgi:hypothetical protein